MRKYVQRRPVQRKPGHHVYKLQTARGRTTYIGKTADPKRRAAEHRRDGKAGSMQVVASFGSHRAARRSEASRLWHHRQSHGGQNPQHNKTTSGGWVPRLGRWLRRSR